MPCHPLVSRLPALAMITGSALALAFIGCGGGDRGQTRPDSAVNTAEVVATASDIAWADLVRRQSEQLNVVARRARSATNRYEFWQVANQTIALARQELTTTPTSGLSDCMASVPASWDRVLTGFTLAGLGGTGGATVALRNSTLAIVENCTASAGATAESGVSSGAASAATETAASAPNSTWTSFRTPGAAALCQVADGSSLYCWTPNDGFWVNLMFLDPPRSGYDKSMAGQTQKAIVNYATDEVTWREPDGTLEYGEEWRWASPDGPRFDYVCRSEATGLTCDETTSSHGFWFGRYKGYRIY